MQYNTIIPLDWDSSFFGYKVAQIIFHQSGSGVLNSLVNELNFKAIRLTYLFATPDDIELNKEIIKAGGILVDKKTIFSKMPQPHSEYGNKIIDFNGTEPNEKLIKLGLQAGKYSRFRTDKNFVNKEYERLYSKWLVNSINKTLAFKVLVAVYEDDIIGLTTLGRKSNFADIGLVSVDKNFNGRGIGTDLIHSADDIAFKLKFHKIKVVTQQQNSRACNLYEKCNFHIEKITNVYHLWNF